MDVATFLLDLVKGLATGIPIAGALYAAWTKHTKLTTEAFARIIEAAVMRRDDLKAIEDRVARHDEILMDIKDVLTHMNMRTDQIYTSLLSK